MEQCMVFLGTIFARSTGAILSKMCAFQAVDTQPMLLHVLESLRWCKVLELVALKEQVRLFTHRTLLDVFGRDMGSGETRLLGFRFYLGIASLGEL